MNRFSGVEEHKKGTCLPLAVQTDLILYTATKLKC